MARSTAPVLDRRTLNRTLLHRQRLLARHAGDPLETVAHLVGLQAQEPVDPYVALWSRHLAFDPEAVGEAIGDRRAMRLGLMRGTLHLVTAEDALGIAPITEAVHRRAFGGTAFARAVEGLDLHEVLAAARDLLEAEPRTPSELGRLLAERWPDRDPTALAISARYGLALVQVPPRGLWRRSGRATNTTLEAWTGAEQAAMPIETLVLRYLAAFGPASVADARAWSYLTGLREVIEGLRPRLRTYADERGRELFDVPDGEIVPGDVPAPARFLPQYDNLFLSHDDRSRIAGGVGWDLAAFAWKGPFLVDGFIVGAWRVRPERGVATMTIEPMRALSAPERTEVEAEGTALLDLLAGDLPGDRRVLRWVAAPD